MALQILSFGCAHRPLPSLDYGQFLERSYQRFLDSRSPFQASGRLRITAPGLNRMLDFALRWESPVRLRLDISGPVGMPLASAALADSLAWLWAPLAGIDVLGRYDDLDSLSLNRLGMSIQKILSFIEGWPLMPLDRNPPALTKRGSIVYNIVQGDTLIFLELDRFHGMPLSLKINYGRGLLWEAGFGNQQPFGQGFRPGLLCLRVPAQEFSLNMEMNLIRRSQPFPAEVWCPPARKTVN